MTARFLLSILLPLAGLASCGGGGSSGPAVVNLSAGNLRFGLTTTVTINGSKLRDGIDMTVEGPCVNLTRVDVASDDTQQFTCDVRGVGEVRFFVVDAGGKSLARLTAEVQTPQMRVTTSAGSFLVELDPIKAPATALNFSEYVRAGFYTSVIVHRAIKNRGIITGAFTSGLQVKLPTRGAFALESNNGLKNLRGTIGSARDGTPDSARALWYVNLADNADLDFVDEANPGYAVFGRVVGGLEVVDAISGVETRPDLARNLGDVPVTEIIITSITRLR